MDTQALNLARKWRSKTFDQIVGQDLPVRMLKNSLYLNQYFPVYLFSGQKGCGKTSTARVFAAAVNCQQLETFQKNPKNALLPCLACTSCIAFATGKHPDFIEIDAASNTGVDNVRQIIDSSALLPLMGRKKIYLIDEAHMLSKAAFNAFLKLMEEPPSSVIFILATTDAQKIIETVRSRCFQLLFKPVHDAPLLNHLKTVCDTEKIAYEVEGLQLLICQTGGSIRDALNLLEQVRFSDVCVTKQAVNQVLGHLDDTQLLLLFEIILYKQPTEFLQFAHENSLEKYSAEFLWQRIVELIRACIWIKNGITPLHFMNYTAQLQFLVKGKSLKYLSALLELFYNNESLFRKTTAQHAFLEVILLKICQKNESNSNSSMPAMMATAAISEAYELEAVEGEEEADEEESDESPSYEEDNAVWNSLIEKVQLLRDPLLDSIFKQARFVAYDNQTGILQLEFPRELNFFNEMIEASKAQWLPLLQQAVEKTIIIAWTFTASVEKQTSGAKVASPIAQPVKSNPTIKKETTSPVNSGYRYKKTIPALGEIRIDVSNKAEWPNAHVLLEHFPGTITVVKEAI